MRISIFICFVIIILIGCIPISANPNSLSPTNLPTAIDSNLQNYLVGKILYITSDNTINVFISSPNANNPGMILSDIGIRAVSLSPDAKQLAYVVDEMIYVKNITDGQVRQLSTQHISGFFNGMDWSPDSKWIGFDCLIENISEICIMDIENGSLKALTNSRSFGAQFLDGAMFGSWNDDGSQIVYCLKVSSPQGGVPFTRFMLLNTVDNSSIPFMEDRNETGLTNYGCPIFRPFSLSILFTAKKDEKYGIFSAGIDGHNIHPITDLLIKYDIHEPITINPSGEYFFANAAKQASDELMDVPTLFSSEGQIVFQLDLPNARVVSWVNE